MTYLPKIEDCKPLRSPDKRTYVGFKYLLSAKDAADGVSRYKEVRFGKHFRVTTMADWKDRTNEVLNGFVAQDKVAGVPTLKEVFDGWLAADPKRGGPRRSAPSYLKHFANWFGPHRPATDVTPADMQRYINEHLAKRRAKTTLSVSFGYCRSALVWGKDAQLLPASYLPPKAKFGVTVPEVETRKDQHLTPEEEAALWVYIEQELHAPQRPGELLKQFRARRWCAMFCAVILETAARAGAACELQWNPWQVDMTRRVINLAPRNWEGSKTKHRGTMPMTERLHRILTYWRKEQMQDGGGVYVIGGQETRYDTTLRCSNIRAFLERGGFKGDGFNLGRHVLRRSWGRVKAAAGVDMAFIAEVMADNPDTVRAHYVDFVPDNPVARAAMEMRPILKGDSQ